MGKYNNGLLFEKGIHTIWKGYPHHQFCDWLDSLRLDKAPDKKLECGKSILEVT